MADRGAGNWGWGGFNREDAVRQAVRKHSDRERREGEAVPSQDFSPSIFHDFSPYYKHYSFETYLIQH